MGRSRSLEHLLRPHTAGPGLEVYAVEDTSAQLVWSELSAGLLQLRVEPLDAGGARPRTRRLEHRIEAGAGALDLDGLRPGTRHRLEVTTPDGGRLRRWIDTLPAPLGPELFRFATVSDLHLGRSADGYRLGEAMARPELAATGGSRPLATLATPATDHPRAAATAAVREALAWGAEHLVVKGDLCDESYDWIWDQAQELLAGQPVPVSIVPGNHDTGSLRRVEPEAAAARRGLHVTRGVEHVDLPGLRLVLLDSTCPGTGWGAVDRHSEEVATLCAEAATGVVVATHHHAQRFAVPLFWPHGIPAPDAGRFVTGVAASSSRVLVTSGHTHRCRRRRIGGLTWTEVAATSHYPGVWAGYVVHPGGIRQVVRRIVEPDVLRRTEQSRSSLAGVWALWSAGEMSDRCFTLDWS